MTCTEMEARRLCTLIHLRFHKAIDMGLIKVVRHWWHWHLLERE